MEITSLKDLSNILDKNKDKLLINKLEIVNSYIGNDWKKFIIEEAKCPFQKVEIPCETCDIFIITWKPHCRSGIHDHPKYGCIMKYLTNKGKLLEHRYTQKLNYIESEEIKDKSISYINNDLYYHNVENPMNEYLYTLHVYQPKKYITHYFKKN
jgi:hypothetical protein